MASSAITDTLDQLAVPFDPDYDTNEARAARIAAAADGKRMPLRTQTPFDAVLATSMLQVGVDVLRLLAVVMAEALSTGTALVDSLGVMLNVDVATAWQADDLFFDLVRDREVVSAMLTDVIGETAARSYLTDTGKAKKQIIRNALAGHGREKVEGWCPRWMSFPQGQYAIRTHPSGFPG